MKGGLAVGRRRLIFIWAVSLLMIALACGLGCAGGNSSSENAAAVFGEHEISEEEVNDYTRQFREARGLLDDEAWRNYLITNDLTAKSWREEVIRQKADRLLIEDKARELGITVDERSVEDHIAQDKEAAGIDSDDERAWSDYLAQSGQTPEGLRDAYEYSSVQQQVFSSEIEFTSEMESQMCDDYIRANLADQVVRRYGALTFALDDRKSAEDALGRLRNLSGSDLLVAFEQELAQRERDGRVFTTDAGISDGDLGWDFLYEEYTVDPDLNLRKSTLEPGALYPEVLAGEDALRVVACTERAEFSSIDYDALESDDLKDIIARAARTSNWMALCLNYMSELEDAAGIRVAPIPDDVPYYVEIENNEDGRATD